MEQKGAFPLFLKIWEPFFGVTVKVDCTSAYKKAKEKDVSFFLYYLYRALKAANEVENFRYRIIENQVFEFEKVNASPTINRPNGTFGFAYMDYFEDEKYFARQFKRIEGISPGEYRARLLK